MRRQDDVSDIPRATELLGRALQGVPMPSGPGADAVFARAARVRRRGAVTGTAAAVAAVSLVGTGVLPWNGPEGPGTALSGGTSRAERPAGLLPPGTGEIREVGNVVGEGPYDGLYAVHRDGGVGYLDIQVLPSRREDWPVCSSASRGRRRPASPRPCRTATYASPPSRRGRAAGTGPGARCGCSRRATRSWSRPPTVSTPGGRWARGSTPRR